MKGKKRHDFVYMFLSRLISPFIHRKFNFECDFVKVEHRPYIVISNHVTGWDPILIGMSFKTNMYYVATDQLLRMGLKSRLVKYFFAPIPRVKTVNETQTVISIFRRLKDKGNICIFAEGETSYDGVTHEVQPSIGKLVKRAGVTLVTYRFSGGYFSFPRWARFISKGKIEGRIVQIYSPEKLASMSENEIYEEVKNDIYVNAYSDQEKNPVAYRGKKRAECIEAILYCCPKCKQFNTLKSCDDIVSCVCGFKVRYNEYCYFEIPNKTEQPPYRTITDWVKWQRGELAILMNKLDSFDVNEPVFTDENQELYEVQRAASNNLLAEGKLVLYKDRLTFTSETGAGFEFLLETVNDVSVFLMMRIIFSTNENKIIEIRSKHPRSALKYFDIIKAIKAAQNRSKV